MCRHEIPIITIVIFVEHYYNRRVADEQRYYRNFMVPFIDVIMCLMKISSNCWSRSAMTFC